MASLTLGALLIAGGLATHYQLRHWENSETLFRRALAVTEKNYLAHHSLAFHLATVGRTAEAQYHYEQALAILPTYYEAHLNLGLLLLAQGSLDAAAEHFLEALRCHPDSVEGHYNYGVILGRQGREAEAMEAFQRVLALQPDHLNAHYNLGLALAKFDRPQEAEFHYREALRLGERQVGADDARLALPHYQLGLLLQQQGRDEEAREHFDRAARLRQLYPVDGGTGRIFMRVPIEGHLYELTLKQAEAIVAFRDAHGPFESFDELVKVDGVGWSLLKANGLARRPPKEFRDAGTDSETVVLKARVGL